MQIHIYPSVKSSLHTATAPVKTSAEEVVTLSFPLYPLYTKSITRY